MQVVGHLFAPQLSAFLPIVPWELLHRGLRLERRPGSLAKRTPVSSTVPRLAGDVELIVGRVVVSAAVAAVVSATVAAAAAATAAAAAARSSSRSSAMMGYSSSELTQEAWAPSMGCTISAHRLSRGRLLCRRACATTGEAP